ncbi:hypothetical protein COCSADRAFT_252977 [Bipolaris sorokiniana ND90Pr]|nr:uncharacterized protein COCSADRAFT_252977 [Bipolaris sorokiniana ND90Pr]EMD59704.1 hypothetical protein COCSADRAFT_252977 [Bipolaris sorokiniana ND90Pr]
MMCFSIRNFLTTAWAMAWSFSVYCSWQRSGMISIPSLASLSATVAALDSHLVLTRATFRECFVDGSGNIGFLPASPGRV